MPHAQLQDLLKTMCNRELRTSPERIVRISRWCIVAGRRQLPLALFGEAGGHKHMHMGDLLDLHFGVLWGRIWGSRGELREA